jgi:lipoprotein-anchoring transpeptidase ErfK/SrfK
MRLVRALALAFALFGGVAEAQAAGVQIVVDLGGQVMRVAAASGETYEWPISSGGLGRATPRGEFRPYALYPMVHSWKYGNEPMPYSIFFHGQYAIHGTLETDRLGRPASHGCIRLDPRAAATLYALVSREGAVIHIGGGPEFVAPTPSPRLIALPFGRALELAPSESTAGR